MEETRMTLGSEDVTGKPEPVCWPGPRPEYPFCPKPEEEKEEPSESEENPGLSVADMAAMGCFTQTLPDRVPNPYFVPRRICGNENWKDELKRYRQIAKDILQIYVKNGLTKNDIDYVANLVALAVNDRPLTKEYVDGIKP